MRIIFWHIVIGKGTVGFLLMIVEATHHALGVMSFPAITLKKI